MTQEMVVDQRGALTSELVEVEEMKHHLKKELNYRKGISREGYRGWSRCDWSRQLRKASCLGNGAMRRKCGII